MGETCRVVGIFIGVAVSGVLGMKLEQAGAVEVDALPALCILPSFRAIEGRIAAVQVGGLIRNAAVQVISASCSCKKVYILWLGTGGACYRATVSWFWLFQDLANYGCGHGVGVIGVAHCHGGSATPIMFLHVGTDTFLEIQRQLRRRKTDMQKDKIKGNFYADDFCHHCDRSLEKIKNSSTAFFKLFILST